MMAEAIFVPADEAEPAIQRDNLQAAWFRASMEHGHGIQTW